METAKDAIDLQIEELMRKPTSDDEYSQIDAIERSDPFSVERYKKRTWAGVEYNILNYEEDQYYAPEEQKMREESAEIVAKWALFFTLIGLGLVCLLLWYMFSHPALMARAFDGSYIVWGER